MQDVPGIFVDRGRNTDIGCEPTRCRTSFGGRYCALCKLVQETVEESDQ